MKRIHLGLVLVLGSVTALTAAPSKADSKGGNASQTPVTFGKIAKPTQAITPPTTGREAALPDPVEMPALPEVAEEPAKPVIPNPVQVQTITKENQTDWTAKALKECLALPVEKRKAYVATMTPKLVKRHGQAKVNADFILPVAAATGVSVEELTKL